MKRPTAEDRAWFRVRRRAFEKFDRSTAYGCAIRDVPFDPVRCAEFWTAYLALIDG